MVIYTRYEFGPKVMNIQEGYKKKLYISLDMISVIPCNSFAIWSNCDLVRILVLRFVIPYACTLSQ